MGKRVKTVIASVLKPIDDTRMYEKIGLSLQQTNRYEVNIIGFRSKNVPVDAEIQFYPQFDFERKSLKRVFASISYFLRLLKIRPGLIIFSTYELIPATMLYHLIFKNTSLIYDIQENYALNVLSNNQSNLQSRVIAKVIQYLEKKAQIFVSLNFLAENNYTKEIRYLAKTEILLNKFKNNANKLEHEANSNKSVFILFCGTVSEDYGIWQSVELVKNLAIYFPSLKTKFIGHVPNTKLLNKIFSIEKDLFEFRLDSKPVPHQEILKEIAKADFGIVAHQPTLSIRNCFPTRIYEFMHFRIPMLLQDHAPWVRYCQKWDSCIPLDFNQFDAASIAKQMQTRKFYSKGKPDDIYWESEEKKLIKAVDLFTNAKY